jgi:hypothetical protein
MKNYAQTTRCCALNLLGAGLVLGLFVLIFSLVVIIFAPILGPGLPLF